MRGPSGRSIGRSRGLLVVVYRTLALLAGQLHQALSHQPSRLHSLSVAEAIDRGLRAPSVPGEVFFRPPFREQFLDDVLPHGRKGNAVLNSCQYAPMSIQAMYARITMSAKYSTAVAQLLKLRKLSQNGLAKLSGVSQRTISRIVRGEVSPDYETLFKLATGLRAPLAQVSGEAPISDTDDASIVWKVMQELPPYKQAMLRAAAEKLAEYC